VVLGSGWSAIALVLFSSFISTVSLSLFHFHFHFHEEFKYYLFDWLIGELRIDNTLMFGDYSWKNWSQTMMSLLYHLVTTFSSLHYCLLWLSAR
jgi:hypothetical protein